MLDGPEEDDIFLTEFYKRTEMIKTNTNLLRQKLKKLKDIYDDYLGFTSKTQKEADDLIKSINTTAQQLREELQLLLSSKKIGGEKNIIY